MLKTAWKFIKFDKAKSIGVIVGILISTFLIGQQLGVFIFLTGLMKSLANNVKADIWVVDSKTQDVNQLGFLDLRTLRIVQGYPGVKEAFPIIISGAVSNYKNNTSGAITLIGVDLNQLNSVLDSSNIVEGKASNLLADGAVSGDYFDRKNLGDTISLGTEFEINSKRAFFALQTKGFRGFGASYCVTSLERARYYTNQNLNNISAVLIKVNPGTDPKELVGRINHSLYGVRAWTSYDLGYSSIVKILGSSGIALSTGTLIIFALISGFFIIGLTMYSSALDRLKDYGTLKAIGAGNAYISRLILLQALLFALVGFSIGFLFLEGFRNGVAKSGLIFKFPPLLILSIFIIIVLISLGGASFALGRIRKVEPGAVFR